MQHYEKGKDTKIAKYGYITLNEISVAAAASSISVCVSSFLYTQSSSND